MKYVTTRNCTIGLKKPLTIIAGPCVIENERMVLQTAENLSRMLEYFPVQFVFKTSYRKANRTSINSFRGIDFEEAMRLLQRLKTEFSFPILTDVHTELEMPIIAEIVDIIQIPAFLSRQTDLLISAGRTNRVVNIKKGQFLAAEDMINAAEKIASVGNSNILLTERGTTFGYRNLVVDMRNLVIMSNTGYPVVYDATHSIQLPGGMGNSSGGQTEFIAPLARAAIATGVISAVFMEVHPDPSKALSDATTQLPLHKFPTIVEELLTIYEIVS